MRHIRPASRSGIGSFPDWSKELPVRRPKGHFRYFSKEGPLIRGGPPRAGHKIGERTDCASPQL